MKFLFNQVDKIRNRTIRNFMPERNGTPIRRKFKWISFVQTSTANSTLARHEYDFDKLLAVYRLRIAPRAELIGRTFGFTQWYRKKYGYIENSHEFLAKSIQKLIDNDEIDIISLNSKKREDQEYTYFDRSSDKYRKVYLEMLSGSKTIEQYVNEVYPPSKFPLLYNRYPIDIEIPEDMDGRAIHDELPHGLLGAKYIPVNRFQEIYDEAVIFGAGDMLEGITVQGLPYAILMPFIIIYALHLTTKMVDLSSAMAVESGTLTEFINQLINSSSDSWGSLEGNSHVIAKLASFIGSVLTTGFTAFCLVGMFLTLYIGAGWRYYRNTRGVKPINRIRTRVWMLADSLAGHFRGGIGRGADMMRFNEYRTSLLRAESQVGDDLTPVFILGKATGNFNYLGLSASPPIDTPMALSMADMSRHLLVMGGTGGGKTSQVAKPIIERTLAMRASGLPVAMYVTDGKAVLFNTVLEEARKQGITDHVRVIGPGLNQIRVDLLEGVDPATFADVMRSVAQQIGGGRNDGNFWPQMASSMVMETGIILQAAELTNWGIEFSRKTGKRIYSIQQIIHYSSEPQAVLDGPIRAISEAMNDPEQYKCIAVFDKPALHNAIEQRIGFWHTLADATRTGIVANIRNALQLFLFNDEIASGFADGAGENLMSATEVFGNYITCTSISTSEHGAAGKLTLTLLKTIFMREARLRELRNPDAAAQRESFWMRPNMNLLKNVGKHEVSNFMQTIYLADEYQELISADTSSAYSDSTFWNVARSAGVAGVVMFQTLKALTQAIGTEATENFVGNFRSKILMPVEDITTISWFSELIGKGYGNGNNKWFGRSIYPNSEDIDQYINDSIDIVDRAPLEFVHAGAVGYGYDHKLVSAFEFMTRGSIGDIPLLPFSIAGFIPFKHKFIGSTLSFFSKLNNEGIFGPPGHKIRDNQEFDNRDDLEMSLLGNDNADHISIGSSPKFKNLVEISDVKLLPFGYGIALLNRAGVVRADVIDLCGRDNLEPSF